MSSANHGSPDEPLISRIGCVTAGQEQKPAHRVPLLVEKLSLTFHLGVICPGRLLRANHIIFNWDRLASWINMTEEWPYRTSWLILFLEETDGISDQVTLKTIYERYVHTHTHLH